MLFYGELLRNGVQEEIHRLLATRAEFETFLIKNDRHSGGKQIAWGLHEDCREQVLKFKLFLKSKIHLPQQVAQIGFICTPTHPRIKHAGLHITGSNNKISQSGLQGAGRTSQMEKRNGFNNWRRTTCRPTNHYHKNGSSNRQLPGIW